MELKSTKSLGNFSTSKVKSHLYGIEMFMLAVETACFSWLNRTFMELKFILPLTVN